MDEGGAAWLAATEMAELSPRLESCLGPAGRAALMAQLTPHQLAITRSGHQLLQLSDTASSSSPVSRLIRSSAAALHGRTGDGVKTFYLMLSSLLVSSAGLDRVRLRRQLASFLRQIGSFNPDSAPSRHYILHISQSFLFTRFTPLVASTLFRLFHVWIDKNSDHGENVFEYLLVHFDSLVDYQQNNCLDESRVERGFQVNGRFSGNLPKNEESYTLMTMYLSEENEDEDSDLKEDMRRLLSQVGDKDGPSGRLLLVTNAKVRCSSKMVLLKEGWSLLSHVTCCKVRTLHDHATKYCQQYKEHPHVTFSWTTNSHTTHIVLNIKVHSLKLAGPNSAFVKSYVDSLKDCLKLCLFTLGTKSCVLPCGQFENYLYYYLGGNSQIVPSRNKRHLLHWNNAWNHCKRNLEDSSLSKQKSSNNEFIRQLKKLELVYDPDVVILLCQILVDIKPILPDSFNKPGLEPLTLKLTILQTVIQTFLSISNIDIVVTAEKK